MELYVRTFVKMFDDKEINVTWRKDGVSFRSNVNLTQSLSDINPELTEEEFVNTVFRIAVVAQQIANNKDIDSEEEVLSELVLTLFLEERPELRNFILVHTSSQMRVLENVEYQIVTKMDSSDASKALANTMLLNIVTRDISKTEDDYALSNICLELSSKDINDILVLLKKSIDDLKLCQIH